MNQKRKDIQKKRELSDKEKVIIRAYKQAFGTPSGQVVLDHLEEMLHRNRMSFTPGEPDLTNYNEGRRSVALMIRNYVDFDLGESGKQDKAKRGDVL